MPPQDPAPQPPVPTPTPVTPPPVVEAPVSAPPANVPTAAPALVAPPVVTPAQTTPAPTPTSKFSLSQLLSKTVLTSVVAVALVCALLGGVAFAYVHKLGPFGSVPYTESNLVSGLLEASSRIETAHYGVKGAISVSEREEGARPFEVQVSNEAELRENYQNDYTRVRSVRDILYALSEYEGNYPASLASVSSPSKYQTLSKNDPVTGNTYKYNTIQNGKNFELTVTFDTKEAISSVKKVRSYGSQYSATSTPIHGQTITFTKDSDPYDLYVPSVPPKPFLVELGEMLRSVPADIAASLSVDATTDLRKEDADWKFNFDLTADFGDLNFKVNADALRADKIYYVRINNIPSLLGASLAAMKGQWIKADPAASSTATVSSYNEYKSLINQIPSIEKKYKENRAESEEFMKSIAKFADEEKLFAFKNAPHSDSVDGRSLYRYDLAINKDAIVPFYKKMVTEANSRKSTSYSELFSDEGTIEYLESPEFTEVFNYLQKNITLTLWVDSQGYPAQFEYNMRIVPPDTAEALLSKQINLVFTYVFSNINEPVNIEVPKDAKPIEELIKSTDANNNYELSDARTNGRDARRVADIRQIQLGLELFYNDKGTYPTALSSLTGEYMSSVPKDPSTNASYKYAATGSSCSGYHLGATLEATNSALSTDTDTAVKTVCSGSAADFNGKAVSCGGASGTDLCYDVTN